MANKKIKTPSGKDVEINNLLTGRDIEYIEQPMLDLKIGFSEKGKVGGEINAGDAKKLSLHRAIERVVVSVDGKSEGVVDLVLDLPVADYKAIVKEVDDIVSGENF